MAPTYFRSPNAFSRLLKTPVITFRISDRSVSDLLVFCSTSPKETLGYNLRFPQLNSLNESPKSTCVSEKRMSLPACQAERGRSQAVKIRCPGRKAVLGR